MPFTVPNNAAAWTVIGNVVPEGEEMSVEDVLGFGGIDWEVAKVPLYVTARNDMSFDDAVDSYEEDVDANNILVVEDQWGIQRQTDGFTLGCVGSQYTPVQNKEGFAILADAMEQSKQELVVAAAGALDKGRQCWILARMAKDMVIAGEKIQQFLLFSTRHDGRQSVTSAATNVRASSQTMLNFAFASAPRIYRVRHTKNANQRVKEAKRILGLRSRYADELKQMGEWLASKKMSDGKFNEFVEKLMPMPDDEKESSPARTMIGKRRDQLAAHYFQSAGIKPIKGSRWGALNAVVEFADHGREFKDDGTQMKAQIGQSKIKDNAYLLLAAEKVAKG